MANNALQELLTASRRAGQELSGKQREALAKALTIEGKKGRGKTITRAELQRGAKKSGQDFEDFLGTVSRNFAAERFGGKTRNIFEKQGFQQEGTKYAKYNPLSQKDLDKALEAGYSASDIRDYVAKNFAQSELGDQIGKFMGEGNYSLDPSKGIWNVNEPIDIKTDTTVPSVSTVASGETKGPFAGLDPDAFPGSTVAEMLYATTVDPYKIQAKSSERERKLAALTGLRGAKISQATSLYNLIPYAFQ